MQSLLCLPAATRALLLTGAGALLLLEFRNYSFWTRAEPLQAFCVSATLLAAARGRGHVATIAMGLAIGILFNAKITGPLYVLPLLVMVLATVGVPELGIALILGVDRILGCPHEEGIDYAVGEACPQCPHWAGRDRFAG